MLNSGWGVANLLDFFGSQQVFLILDATAEMSAHPELLVVHLRDLTGYLPKLLLVEILRHWSTQLRQLILPACCMHVR